MSDEIVKRLRNRSNREKNFLKESLSRTKITEADEDEESLEPEVEEGDTVESPVPEETPEDTPEVSEEEVDSDEEEYVDPDGDTEEENAEEEEGDTKEYINPLDNNYAVKHNIGEEVILAYSNGTKSKLKGEIDGYDKEGFYRIRWSNGLTTNGITDLALANIVQSTDENTCVCGSDHFVTEGKYVVCDNCGRRIRESVDPLTLADKSRPKKKKLIRSEAHPVSTIVKPDISEAIKSALKKKPLNEYNPDEKYAWWSDPEDEDEEEEQDDTIGIPDRFYKLYNKLKGDFWTRLPELIEDIEELGYDVVDSNNEYIIVAPKGPDSDDEYQIFLGGTSRTMTLDFARARLV